MASLDWALNQISRLLPLDEESLKQILEYSSTLSEDEAAKHLGALLGESPQSLEFISSFNSRRQTSKPSAQSSSASATQDDGRVPRAAPRQKKKKAPLSTLPAPRRPDDYGNVQGAYQKKEEGDYISASQRQRKDESNPFSLSSVPAARQAPTPALLDPNMPNIHTRTASPSKFKQQSRTASPANRSALSESSSQQNSRAASPSKKSKSTKVSIPGGTPMHGSSSTLSDLDSAIRALEATTNPTILPPDPNLRRCSCMGSLHPLLTAAPNCLSCGKIICAKEGLAPCTFCGASILTGAQVQEMIESLRLERSKEKTAANNAAQGARAGKGPAGPSIGPEDTALAKAQAHRDKLLGFQASNAQRTKVVDEASAFETPDSGMTQWGSAEERAAQLRRQQRVLKEMEWNARPEWEKRKVVVSLDLVGGKAVRRMQEIGMQEALGDEENPDTTEPVQHTGGNGDSPKREAGAFSKNPLLGELVKPMWKRADEEQTVEDQEKPRRRDGRAPWRRVQDDADDNEEIILNGGIYSGRENERKFAEEPACG